MGNGLLRFESSSPYFMPLNSFLDFTLWGVFLSRILRGHHSCKEAVQLSHIYEPVISSALRGLSITSCAQPSDLAHHLQTCGWVFAFRDPAKH